MQDLAGKVAFITGGASGLGLAMARSFTGAGMKVVIADIEDDALDAAAQEFSDANVEVLTMKVDVTNRDAMAKAAEETIAAFDKVHVLCNNAGVALNGNIADMGYKDWDWVMKVNLDGVVNGMVAFLPHMKDHGEGGHVVNTASMAGQVGMGSMSVYNTTKFAVVGMSEAAKHDLEPFNIGVSVLCPGFVATQIYTSERNRPAALGGISASSFNLAADAIDDPERAARINQVMNAAMDPQIIGDMVLHAVQTNELYIMSHPEFKEAVASRGQQISDAFDRWTDWRFEQGV